jgi:hypothetical protein
MFWHFVNNGATVLSKIRLSTMTLSIITLSIMTLRITMNKTDYPT